MIIAFYACMVVVAIVVLIYAIVISAPTIAARATDAWDWWRSLPIHDLLVVPVSETIRVPIADYTRTLARRFGTLGAQGWGCSYVRVLVAVHAVRASLDHGQYRREVNAQTDSENR